MKKNKTRIRKPVMKWQKGLFQRNQTMKFELPVQFLMLCKLVDVPPHQVLIDFIDNLSCGSWKREGRDRAKQFLMDYFIEHGYGQPRYTGEEIRTMFRELDAVGLLFPKEGDHEVLDSYSTWREQHQVYWFNKWNR